MLKDDLVNLRVHLQGIKERRGSWGLGPGVGQLILYLRGFEDATSREVLAGLGEWVNSKHGGPGKTNLVWTGEIKRWLPNMPSGPYYEIDWEIESESSDRYERAIFDTIFEFIDFRLTQIETTLDS